MTFETAVAILQRSEQIMKTETVATASPPPKQVKELITHCQICGEPVPVEQQGSAKTCSSCGADLSRGQRSG